MKILHTCMYINCHAINGSYLFIYMLKMFKLINFIPQILHHVFVTFGGFRYVIEVIHKNFSWKVKKRFHHFRKLDAELLIHRALKRKKQDPGRLSFAPANLMQTTEERQKAVQSYLQNILDKKGYSCSRKLQEFFEISRLSFIKELGMKRR